ncbi:unnamed protein product [Dracunculus medinensis]|uniref:Uncharacterized protein n=1 Tax=Dracunculus medinensis TaxID=318479 RepID=A0A0N4U1N0_DRAME|nr:unnamed protein product [Dracunculus medinensis]
MKTAVFGHDDSCDGSSLALNSGAVAPSLTFTPPAILSAAASLHPRRSGGALAASVSTYRAQHSRRTSRMQNVSFSSKISLLY